MKEKGNHSAKKENWKMPDCLTKMLQFSFRNDGHV